MSHPRILIIEDHPLMADALQAKLQSLLPQLVCIQASTLQQGLAFLQDSSTFILVLIDLNLPDSRGLSTLHAVCNNRPTGSLVVFSSVDNFALQAACLANDVLYLCKSRPVSQVLSELMAVLAKASFRCRLTSRSRWHEHIGVDSNQIQHLLSRRQFLILAYLSQGKSNREIANALHIGENTVRTHMTQIYQRLQVRNRIEASTHFMLWAQQLSMNRD